MIKNSNSFVSTEYILSNYNQEDIFRLATFKTDSYNLVRNPLKKKDSKGTCTFDWVEGILIFTDWGLNLRINCIQAVQHYHKISYNNAKRLIVGKIKKLDVPIDMKFDYSYKSSNKIEILTEAQEWSTDNYFTKYGISNDILIKEDIVHVSNYWCNTSEISKLKVNRYFFPSNELRPDAVYTIAYNKNGKVKMYMPYQKSFKWFQNTTKEDYWGEDQLSDKKSNVCIWTKSTKDYLLWRYVGGVDAYSGNSESTSLPISLIEYLKSVYDKVIIILDTDTTGIECMKRFANRFDIDYSILDITSKDLTDYYLIDKVRCRQIMKSYLT